MIVEDFALFSVDDPTDDTFDCEACWSRTFEYPFAISHLRGRVHNTAWGYEGIHVVFRDWLDSHFDTVHSDRLAWPPGPSLSASRLHWPETWDITTPPRDEWLGAFDTVLSISVLEEVRGQSHWRIIVENFLPQLAPGGKLVVTFDLPGFQLADIEKELGRKVSRPDVPLTSANSPIPGPRQSDPLHVGRLVVTV